MSNSLYPKNLTVLLAFFVFFQSNINGQSKEEFEQIFLKETQESESGSKYGRFKNIANLSYYPDTLPSWFFNPPHPSSDFVYSIGISDPDLTPNEAAFQAFHRAKTMAILYNKVQIQYFRDVYSVEYTEGSRKKYGQRFDTYFKLSSSGFADSSCFKVVNYHFTRYNEAIVLVLYTPLDPTKASMNTDLISMVGTALYIEAQIGDAFEPQGEYEFVSVIRPPKAPIQSSQFTYREKGNRFLSISEFAGKNHDFPLYTYKYSNPVWAHNTEPLVSYNGLWSIYSKRLLRQLTLETEQSSVKIRTLEEQYSPQMRNLSREVAIKTAKMHINGIEFGRDSIGFEIQLHEIK
ncbi:MAG: hypothetical protein CVT98_05380 [Bacteroidetes bacterium HGW-Bacteroidetes-15]|nr:MAG: hypothetical protein CVT98_05380 [Bacteroidetes bacterium HGW-Bacteroidetes-15]